ncbi:MAG: radical SAM family heme chaperone HemW [Clostridia bacterium]|nr:radical SAM family heme chaperone HemW [Clostridia bacterium]
MDKRRAIYIHIPFCKRKCNYCAFVSVCDESKQKPYIKALKNEIEKRGNGAEISTVYVGGGTPSTLYKGAITEVLNCVKNNFVLTPDCEITVEGNPDSITDDFCVECKQNGVNRISMGVQSTCNEILTTLGRIHDKTAYLCAIETVRNHGIFNISCDLIIGVPNQSREQVRADVLELINTDIPHISVYALTIEEGTPFYRDNVTVDEDLQADMYDDVFALLTKNGYNRYEVSNFAKSGFESRHNTKYWYGAIYYGFGASAHSLSDGFIRSENTSDVDDYINGITTVSSRVIPIEERKEEAIMLNLRTVYGLDINDFNVKFSCDLLRDKADEISKLKKLGLVSVKNGILSATDKGFYLLNSIITELI